MDAWYLLTELEAAIRSRPRYQKEFSYLDHFHDPTGYQPFSEKELLFWEELTHPRRHEELKEYIEGKTRSGLTRYARIMFGYLMERSLERKHETGMDA
jgi:hypothetical protein